MSDVLNLKVMGKFLTLFLSVKAAEGGKKWSPMNLINRKKEKDSKESKESKDTKEKENKEEKVEKVEKEKEEKERKKRLILKTKALKTFLHK